MAGEKTIYDRTGGIGDGQRSRVQKGERKKEETKKLARCAHAQSATGCSLPSARVSAASSENLWTGLRGAPSALENRCSLQDGDGPESSFEFDWRQFRGVFPSIYQF